jgi:hypothetical protein
VPDPVTHLCTALLPMSLTGSRFTPVLALGAVLPDLCSRLPSTSLDILIRAGAPVPRWAPHLFTPMHMPYGALLGCLILALLFHERERAAILGWLVAGVALHFGADVLQDHHGEGYRLLFPFDLGKYELGWIGSEATVAWAPWLALVTAVAWGLRYFALQKAKSATN